MVDKSMDSDCGSDEEKLDPRIQLELEKLNAATDGINHLETEFGEAQALFQQMMQDATFHLKSLNQQIGKAVDKSRPYYEALKKAKLSHSTLHEAALKFEQAQSRHYNSKKRVQEAEKRAFSSIDRKLDPALQEMLNHATIEVMEAASASEVAWESHRLASIEFEVKQKAVQVLYKTIQKHIFKSRPYFDMKFNLNKQLEIQKQRLEKIQEGIQLSKSAYSETLHNLEVISDDIHRSREERKRKSMMLEHRGQGVGADSDQDEPLNHSETMKNIRRMSLDDIGLSMNTSDTESTNSDISTDDTLLRSDTIFEENPDLPSIILSDDNGGVSNHSSLNRPVSPGLSSSGEKSGESSLSSSIEEATESTIKEIHEKVDSSYDVITSHSIPISPPPVEILPEFDITDSGKHFFGNLRDTKRARSYTDLRSTGKSDLVDISKTNNDESFDTENFRRRCSTQPNKLRENRKWKSFSVGIDNHNNNSPVNTPESMKKAMARVAALTLSPCVDNDESLSF